MAPGHELRLLTRPSTNARATGTEAAGATDHNPLTARRSTAARSANNKLDCGGSQADAFAASSAAIIFGLARGWPQSSRVLDLHVAAGAVVCASRCWCRPRRLTTGRHSCGDRYEQ